MNDVYGHAKAKKVLEVLYNRSQERYYKKCVKGELNYPERLNCLLVGPSGTGKTHLMKTFAEQRSIPLLCIDATELMPTGNDTGVNKKQLRNMILNYAGEMTKRPQFHSPEGVLNQLFIFVDEFDKLATSFDSSGNWNKHVQSSFLTMIEDKYEFSGISWVFAGAFSMCRENKVKHSIGFFPENKMEAVTDQLTEKDIIKAGIIPEMLGRIPLIVQLDEFTLTNYEEITSQLMQTKYSKLTGINVGEIASIAMSSGQGVRSIIRQLEMALIDVEADEPWVMPTF
jgi:ATP-dependent Clp protease ATP-binding subunit ClpX